LQHTHPEMYKPCLIQKLAILFALALPAAVNGQVPVDISSQKIISGGKVYYMHPVLKGQTLYSISRAYKVTIDDITRTNVISPKGIQTDQVLKIPASEALTTPQPKPQPQSQPKPQPQTQPQPKPEPQSQTQTPPQSQSQPQSQPQPQPQPQTQSQPQSQPQSQTEVKTAGIKTVKAKPESHKVQKGESISSIARDHGVTVRALKQANKGLLFPMPGMYLVIPEKTDEDENSGNQEK